MDVVIADEAISELKIKDKVANARAGDYYLGVSMFDSTREHDTNPTRVFSG